MVFSGRGTPAMAPAIPDDGRPPGGTSRASGNKTPRRVQWLDDNNDTNIMSTHHLDEHGLDVSFPWARVHLNYESPHAFNDITDSILAERL